MLNKYIKCNIWKLAVRYDIYIYVIRLLKVKTGHDHFVPRALVLMIYGYASVRRCITQAGEKLPEIQDSRKVTYPH